MKFFTFKKSHSSIFITLLFVVFVGALYFFIYLPKNEKRVQEQRFRTLQTIDKNIHAKIDNSVALINNLLTSYQQSDSLQAYVRNYISRYPTDKFTLTVPTPKHLKADTLPEKTDSGYIITVNNNNQLITLKLRKQLDPQQPTTHEMSMVLTFEQFIKFLLPQNVFDQYVIFSNNEVVYETFPSGISSLEDTLSNNSRGFSASNVPRVFAGGTDFNVFLQPIKLTTDKKWVLAGLLSNKRYQQEKNQLPSNIVLLLVTFMLIIIVAFPWIKLYQMGNKDRLTTSDGIASIVVAMLLMSLLFFSFFKYNRLLRPEESRRSEDVLAQQIAEAFQAEIDTVYEKLRMADSFFSRNPGLKQVNKLHDQVEGFGNLSPDSVPGIRSLVSDKSINQLFWLNDTGNETANWTAANTNAPAGNFQSREYFRKIAHGRSYLLNFNPSKPFYLDQVISWTSGKFTSVLTIPSAVPGSKVAALSFNSRSLIDPVLPTGYQFAIIDSSANVLYHSDVFRNLMENLMVEFSEGEELKGCITARTEAVFKTKYFSKEYNILFRPLKGLPYSIVIFSDLAFKSSRDMEIYSFTISMLILLFGLLILQLFVVFLLSSKRSFFKKQLFDTSWISPKVKSHKEYNVAIIFNLLIIFLSIMFFDIGAFLAYVFILLFSVTFLSVFQNSLFARRYKLNKQAENYKFKKTTLFWLIVFIIILNITALTTLDTSSTVIFFFYEFICVLVGTVFYFYGYSIAAKILHRFRSHLRNWNYTRSFALMSLTRLIITSGIPVAFFYISSYNYEQNISIRFRQLQYANKLIAKLTPTQLSKISGNNKFNRGFYNDSVSIKEVSVVSKPRREKYSEEDSITAEILGLFRVNLSDISLEDSKFYNSQASDSSFFYNPLLKDACKNEGITTTHRRLPEAGKFLKLSAASLNYRVPLISWPAWRKGFLFYTLLIGAILCFYFIIYNIISRLFCLRLHDLNIWNALDEKILLNPNLNNLIFIIGLPGSGKLTRLKEKIANGEFGNGDEKLIYDEKDQEKNNVYIVDLINIPDVGDEKGRNNACEGFTKNVFDPQIKLIIVNHFEYNIHDVITNRIKLNFLEKIMLKSKSKVVILSTIHPVAFLDSVIDHSTPEVAKVIPGEELERWHVLFGHFRIVVFPLEHHSPLTVEDSLMSISTETQHTHFLKKIRGCAIDITKALREDERYTKADQLIFKIQVASHYFYMYIWQSLTKEEKFLLYDLAEDNLVNSFDDYNLNMLMAKGVIVRVDGALQLFNKGFRNFILTAIGNTEAIKIKNRINDNGNWSSLKTPLLIVLVAILTFLLSFQEESYSKIIAYVAALGTGIPTVIKLFSLFDKNRVGKE